MLVLERVLAGDEYRTIMNGIVFYTAADPNYLMIILSFNDHPILTSEATFELSRQPQDGMDTVCTFDRCLTNYTNATNQLIFHIIPESGMSYLRYGSRYKVTFKRSMFLDNNGNVLSAINANYVEYERTDPEFEFFHLYFEIAPSNDDTIGSSGGDGLALLNSSVKRFTVSSGAVNVSNDMVHIDLSSNPLEPNTIYTVDFTNAILKDTSGNIISNASITPYIFKTGSN